MTTITLPTVHMNGDSAQTLLDDNRHAMDAINTAMDALAKASPNGRNFYPQGPEAISKAISEHSSRIGRLQSIHDELRNICQHVIDTDPKRK